MESMNMTNIVKVTHKSQYKGNKNMKLFDSQSFGERRDVDEGEVCKVDKLRALSNINFQKLTMPFMFKMNNAFNKILQMILKH